MILYDKKINECLELLEKFECKCLNVNSGVVNIDNQQKLIMKSEMAYELGGNNYAAVSGLAFTSSDKCNDEILLYGPDLSEIKGDIAYARLTILNVDDSNWEDNNVLYSSMRKIDYTRYHVYPNGFMMRISTSANREPVRIGRKELDAGLNFEEVGNVFVNEYHKHKEVKGVKIIFITAEKFPYELLNEKVNSIEKITESLNKIFNNLIMDCNTCGLKPVCDEVEGMKELHFSQDRKSHQ